MRLAIVAAEAALALAMVAFLPGREACRRLVRSGAGFAA